MWFWWFMLVCDLLIPILMIIAGNMMWKHSPEKNWVIGYRTDIIGAVGGILCTVQCVILIGSIFPTERALKRTFTDEGIRK